MRLLNARTGLAKEFISDDDCPAYAILSHTWGDDEVSYAEWQSLSQAALWRKEGGKKIAATRRQALKDGLEWIWVDT